MRTGNSVIERNSLESFLRSREISLWIDDLESKQLSKDQLLQLFKILKEALPHVYHTIKFTVSGNNAEAERTGVQNIEISIKSRPHKVNYKLTQVFADLNVEKFIKAGIQEIKSPDVSSLPMEVAFKILKEVIDMPNNEDDLVEKIFKLLEDLILDARPGQAIEALVRENKRLAGKVITLNARLTKATAKVRPRDDANPSKDKEPFKVPFFMKVLATTALIGGPTAYHLSTSSRAN